MLTKIIAELITEKIQASRLGLNQKFCFSVVAGKPDSKVRQDELDFEIMLAGSSDENGNPEYTVKTNGLQVPIPVTLRGVQAVLTAAFIQMNVIDFTQHEPWYRIDRRTEREDFARRAEQTGLLLQIVS